MKRLTDPTFVYRDADHTNLRATFARVRREQREAAAVNRKPLAPVATIPRKAVK